MSKGQVPLTEIPTPLAPGTVYLLWADIRDPGVSPEELERVLSEDERQRAERFRFEDDRLRSQVGWGLLRALLGRFLAQEPEAIQFSLNEFKKPLLPNGPSFNMAHSGACVLIGIAAGGRLGVDVEVPRPVKELDALAETVFSASELSELRALPETERLSAFFRGWTRKEAFVKAIGGGLTVPLKGFSVSLSPDTADALRRVEIPKEMRVPWCVRPLCDLPDAPGAFAWDQRCRQVRRLSPLSLGM